MEVAMAPTVPLDTIYTTDEAAERLRVSRRTMIKLGRDLGSCSMIGREYFFSERDLLDIWQAQRAMPTSSQGCAVKVKGLLSDVRLQHSLQRLTQTKKRCR
ncbi:helix-turn-helix domain-containing protein [Sinorhizobium meliloti]|nr:helix-turn-helix domain-containing protein [Sinorhizobium meliloti]